PEAMAENDPEDLRAFWLRNSLHHVQQQIELYGGYTTWSENLGGNYSNLRRFAGDSERAPGNAVLGYDQYIFQKADLAYATDVLDFVLDTTLSPATPQPAY